MTAGGPTALRPSNWPRRRDPVLAPAGPPFFYITRPRGGRKDDRRRCARCRPTPDGRASPGSTSYLVAADADQAGLVIDSIRSFVGASVRRSRVEVQRAPHLVSRGRRGCQFVRGSPGRLGVELRSSAVFVVADELSVWPSSTTLSSLRPRSSALMPKVSGQPVDRVDQSWVALALVGRRARATPRRRRSGTSARRPGRWVASDETLAEQRAL